jgi:hypothetical protein
LTDILQVYMSVVTKVLGIAAAIGGS